MYSNNYNSMAYPQYQQYPQNQYGSYVPRHEVGRVKGDAGAWSAPMAPNSSEIFLDELSALAYLVQTDSANNRTVDVFDVSPHVTEPPVDMNDILKRLEMLEVRLNESDAVEAEPTTAKRSKSNASKTSVE